MNRSYRSILLSSVQCMSRSLADPCQVPSFRCEVLCVNIRISLESLRKTAYSLTDVQYCQLFESVCSDSIVPMSGYAFITFFECNEACARMTDSAILTVPQVQHLPCLWRIYQQDASCEFVLPHLLPPCRQIRRLRLLQ
jgi:hypothetical protein